MGRLKAAPTYYARFNGPPEGGSHVLRTDRDPDLHLAVAGAPVEALVVAFEFGPTGGFESGLGQPFVPDREPRSADRRDVIPVREHRIALRWDRQPTEVRREVREVLHFDS